MLRVLALALVLFAFPLHADPNKENLASSLVLTQIQEALYSGDWAAKSAALQRIWLDPEFVSHNQRYLIVKMRDWDEPIDPAYIMEGSFRPEPFWQGYESVGEIVLGIIAESVRYERCVTGRDVDLAGEIKSLLTESIRGVGPARPRVAVDCLYYSVFGKPPLIFEPSVSAPTKYVVSALDNILHSEAQEDVKHYALVKLIEAAYALPNARREIISLIDGQNELAGYTPGEAKSYVERTVANYGEPANEATLRSILTKSPDDLISFVMEHYFEGPEWSMHYYVLRYKLDRLPGRDSVVKKLLLKPNMHSPFVSPCIPHPVSEDSTDVIAKGTVDICIDTIENNLEDSDSDGKSDVSWQIQTLAKLVMTNEITDCLTRSQTYPSGASAGATHYMQPYGSDKIIEILTKRLLSKKLGTRRVAAEELGLLSYLNDDAARKIKDSLSEALSGLGPKLGTAARPPESQIAYDSSEYPEWALYDALVSAKEGAERAIESFARSETSVHSVTDGPRSRLASPEEAKAIRNSRLGPSNSAAEPETENGQRVASNSNDSLLPSSAAAAAAVTSPSALPVEAAPDASRAGQAPWLLNPYVAVALLAIAIVVFLLAWQVRRMKRNSTD